MKEIRTLIVDDEPLARRGIRQLLSPYPDFAVVGECRDGREALRSLATLKPDLVFLDIQMPGLTGFEVIRTWGVERMPAVVFVTAHDEFAVRAFEEQTLDYLVKPLSEARFRVTIARVRERMRLAEAVATAGRLAALLALTEERLAPGAGAPGVREPRGRGVRIAVPTPTGDLLLDTSEIDWIEASDTYAVIHAGANRYRLRDTLSALESRLDPAHFARTHRGAIVRLDQVRELKEGAPGSDAVLILRNGGRVPLSRRRLAEVRSLLRRTGRP
jgi:two-component system LytT family response regulator